MSTGCNEYGVPWHACWGYRHDAHYWAWVGHLNDKRQQEAAVRLVSRMLALQ